MNRYDVINALIQRYGFNSYLEIGYQNGVCFDKIECSVKVAIDPRPERTNDPCLKLMTSDQFFLTNKSKFDIVFIDGLHDYNQVKRDFRNSLKIAKIIVLHDMNPEDVEYLGQILTGKERSISFSEGGMWNGDCYKLAIDLYNGEFPYEYLTVNCDNGCGVVFTYKSTQKNYPKKVPKNYESFDKYRVQILRLMEYCDFLDYIGKEIL